MRVHVGHEALYGHIAPFRQKHRDMHTRCIKSHTCERACRTYTYVHVASMLANRGLAGKQYLHAHACAASTLELPTDAQPFSGCDTMTTQFFWLLCAKTQQAPMPGTCLRLGGLGVGFRV